MVVLLVVLAFVSALLIVPPLLLPLPLPLPRPLLMLLKASVADEKKTSLQRHNSHKRKGGRERGRERKLDEKTKKYRKKLLKMQHYIKYPFVMIEETLLLYKASSKKFKKVQQPKTRHFLKKRSKPLNPKYSLKMLADKQKLKKPKRRKKTKGSGFCKICEVYYTDMDKHILKKRHRKFAQNEDNFSEIDMFLKKVKKEASHMFTESSTYSSTSSDSDSSSSSSSGYSSSFESD
ncbi:activator of s-phase kinase-related [Anaeramoeba flamelloides]|uniref:Activator of s-phase kinase-related n=1 Tax=Anaeramoeba flamelloides TaxID=1746091 RepID=A0AAV7ZBZ1_9EUKA|nr:activator of s-phase kinase-related [Anaeramoeba flamelloides]